ncbi:MAG TPA: VWA domain-containing protein [Candidatus Avoscillospira avicola]|uniref:VWA domain-containing protein n=1 Tax=Candidatus Avoscillospira avicola TaxID=2840706 RepID=A0A9D1DI33_9FIRM|nr:VWA domain-containing protein [Candidatus Avoscillospira avicola]
MDDPTVYLEKLSLFARMLRRDGLTVGVQETADASQILISLGFSDREQVKTALQTVFAKSREEQATFDRVFDGFFVSEETMRRQAQEQMQREQELEQGRREAEEDLQIRGEPMHLREDLKEVYAAMPEEERERLRQLMDRYKGNIDRHPDLYGNFIHSVFTRALLEQQMKLEDAGLGVEESDPELGLLYRDISQFRDVEIPRAITLISSITRQINGELTAKRQKKSHSGKLDFRRTIRRGLETGGSLYRLSFKRKPKRRKRLVILCDVSGSMMQFSEFALRFIQAMNQTADSSRVFLFSEELVEADAFSLQNMDLFRNYVRDSGLYGRGTDLGTALAQLLSRRPAVLGPAATLLILSDTKTIDLPRAVRSVLEAKRQAGRVVWMNPIPENKWPYLKSVQMVKELCQMIPCSTLSALAAACRKLVS